MRITSDKFEISASESISWGAVKTLRLHNEKLAFVLENGDVVEVPNLRPSTIDSAFRAYERFLKEHPAQRRR